MQGGDAEVDGDGTFGDSRGVIGVAAGEDAIAVALEKGAGKNADLRVVVDEEDGDWAGGRSEHRSLPLNLVCGRRAFRYNRLTAAAHRIMGARHTFQAGRTP